MKKFIKIVSFLSFLLSFICISCKKNIIPLENISTDTIFLSVKPSTATLKKIESANSIWDILSLVKKVEFNNLPDIDRIRKIKISLSDSVIVFSSKDSKFYIFNLSGKLIGFIENFGSGPKQYKILNEFYLYNAKIYLLVNANKKLQEYDLSGNLLKEYKIRKYLDLPDERMDFEHVFILNNKLFAIVSLKNEELASPVTDYYFLIYDNYKNLINYYLLTTFESVPFVEPQPIFFNNVFFFTMSIDNNIYLIKNENKLFKFIDLGYSNRHISKEIFSHKDWQIRIDLLNKYTTTLGEFKYIQNLFVLDNVLFVYASNDIFAVYEKEGKYYCRKNLLKFDPIKASAEDYNILELVHDKDFLEKHGIDQWAQFFPQDDCIAYVDYASSNDGGNKIIISIFGIK